MSIQEMEDLKQHYLDEMLSLSNDLQIKDYRNEKIDIRFRKECENMIDELKGKFNGMSIEINKKKELQRLEQVANLSTYPLQRFKSFCYDDYAYEESYIPLTNIISELPLIEDLVPIPSESEDTSESDSDCDLPSCDDFSPINIYEEKSMSFSNPLFESNDDFTSSDDESLSDKDVPEDNVKIYSNPLFEFDDEYISSNVNPLFDEVLEDTESEDSYVSKLNEPDFLVTPPSAFNEDEWVFGISSSNSVATAKPDHSIAILASISANPILRSQLLLPEPPVRQPSVESSNLEKPDNPPIVTMDDNRTMAQLLEAPTEVTRCDWFPEIYQVEQL
ncbi:hypothetical protein Tco_0134064 [Tanacetum coccineum]